MVATTNVMEVVDADAAEHLGKTNPAQDTVQTSIFHGQVELVASHKISGWCQNSQEPSTRVILEFFGEGASLGVVICNQYRDDLVANGIGDGMHAFCWLPFQPLTNLQLATLRVRVHGSDHHADIALSPEAEAKLVDAAKESNIVVDAVLGAGLIGWIKDDTSHSHLQVNLKINAELVGTYPANVDRPDLLAAGLSNGRTGFLLPLPESCFDDAPYEVELEVPILQHTLLLQSTDLKLGYFPYGEFTLDRGIVKGELNTTMLPPGCNELSILIDGIISSKVSIPDLAREHFSFATEMPLALCDGESHRVHVALSGTAYRLRNTNGEGGVTFHSQIMGKIDTIDTNGISGWVFDINNSSEAIELEVYDGNTLLGYVKTLQVRADVNKLFNVTGSHGFTFSFPHTLYDGQPHNFRVLHNGEPLNCKPNLLHSITLTPADMAAIPPTARYEGKVEYIGYERVSGWVCDRKNSSRPLQVSVYVDNEFLGITIANRFAARLRNHERKGHHEFLFKLPPAIMNGKKRSVKVYVTEAQFELPNQIGPITFPLVDVLGIHRKADTQPNFSFTPPAQQYIPVRSTNRDLLTSEPGQPVISIIVLNLNGATILRELLESFTRIEWRYDYELLLVDHGSTDGSLELMEDFRDRLPLRLFARGANYSFAASNNFAAKHARGAILAFANNDLVMLHDCLATMAEHLLDPQVGAVGLKLLEPFKTGPNEWEYKTHHQGVNFGISEPLPGTKQRYYLPLEIGEHPTADLAATYDLPISTGALLLCRSSDFAQLDGYHEGYFYGMEDVDLCLCIVKKLGKKVLCDTSAVALHNRSATRDSKLQSSEKEKMYNQQIHSKNRKLYIERFGRHLKRTVMKSLVKSDNFWRPKPLRVVFAVTDTNISTPAGDLFTAMELAEAMHRLFGWDVKFVDIGMYLLPGTDVLVVMRHDYKIQKIVDANPGIVTVAWARNWLDKWAEIPHLDAYQLIFCSSKKSIQYLKEKTGRDSVLLPIATNAKRFAPHTPAAQHASDVTFTGNYWLFEREAIGLQNLVAHNYQFAMYGHGWDKCPEWAKNWRGAVSYDALPEIYSSAKIVLDDSHPVTREWHSLNSRIFDAIGCGRLVMTNCVGGADELFPDTLPKFNDANELQALIQHYLANPEEREALAAKLHADVLANHTYDNRANTFRDTLEKMLESSLRFAIKIGVPNEDEKQAWGDYHFALGIKRALEKQGHIARIDILPNWVEFGPNAGDDVVIVLRGLSQYKPQPTAINLMWLISHPDDVKLSEYADYDHVFVASEPFAKQLAARLGDKVTPLLQCTDPALFYPDAQNDNHVADLLFVGNSRGQQREGVMYALQTGVDFCVYGEMWETILPANNLRGTHIPNDSLRQYYSSANIVLNDHWPDMRLEGFVSNRIYDAGACGATVLTDDMASCRSLFGDTVAYYDSAESLADQTQALIADKAGRKKRGVALRKLILAKHTFDHRVADILTVVDRISK